MRKKNPDNGLGVWLDPCPACGKHREASEIEPEICIECYSYYHRSKHETLESWLIYRLSTSHFAARTETQKLIVNERKRRYRAEKKNLLKEMRLKSSKTILEVTEKTLKEEKNE